MPMNVILQKLSKNLVFFT